MQLNISFVWPNTALSGIRDTMLKTLTMPLNLFTNIRKVLLNKDVEIHLLGER